MYVTVFWNINYITGISTYNAPIDFDFKTAFLNNIKFVVSKGPFKACPIVTIQSPTTNNRHTLQGRLNCKEGTYAMLEGCACV